MSRFWKRFLREGQGLFARGAKPQIWLGAFGKHPGWDDHIDDIGLETESLLLAKQIIYVDGIGGQIGSGEWEKLTQAQRLSEFKHVFLWKRGEAFLLGKIWSSRDGKNRSQFPLIVCAHCLGIPFSWALVNVLRHLDGIERQCKGARLAHEVRGILGEALSELRLRVADAKGQSLPEDLTGREFVERLGLDTDHEILLRIVYGVHKELAAYLAGAKGKLGANSGAGQIRLPAVAGLTAETLSFWTRFLDLQLAKDIPVLLTLPLEERWLDATCGEPASREFYSLRAKPEVLDLASAGDCEISDEFRRACYPLVQATMASVSKSDSPARSKRWFA